MRGKSRTKLNAVTRYIFDSFLKRKRPTILSRQRLNISKKPVYFSIDSRLARRHKTLIFLAGLGQAAAVLVVIVSGIVPNIGNRAYAASGAYAGSHSSDVFVMLVKTDNPGASTSTQFTVPTSGGSYNYNIDCDDDGTWDATGVTGSYTCNYSSAGTYSVVIDGTFPAIYFAYTGEGPKLLEIQQWGNNHWLSMDEAFFNASNMQITASDVPDLSSVTSLYRTFMNTASMNADLSSWDVSTVTSMYQTFYGASSFNQPLNNWDVSHVTDMSGMFTLATTFNQPLSSWDTANVTRMPYMFQQVSAFDQDISNWDISSVIDTSGMFLMASSFNGDIGGWDVSSVTNMESMFNSASAFNQDISGWDVSGVTNMSNMLRWTSFNQDISSWNVSNVTTMYRMFAGTPFNQDISSWDISSVTSLNEMFEGASAFNQPLNDWDTHNVTIMTGVFHGASAFNQPLNNWNISSVINTVSMFQGASAFNQPLDNWDTTNVYNMEGMFSGASSFNQNINSWDTSGLTDARWLFQSASAFNQPLNSWDVSGVTNTYRMFAGASSFNQDISSWNTSNIISMQDMFNGATSFNQPASNWDTSGVTNMTGMFQSAYSFNQPLDSWDTSSVTSIGSMFLYAYAFNQDLGSWDTSNITAMYHVFQGTQFNYDISSWDTSKVTSMRFMFQGTPFNQDISNWDTGAVTDFVNMFSGANSFNQDISGWDMSSVLQADNMLSNSGINSHTYDLILAGWSNQTLQNGVTFGASGKSYCAATAARQNIIDNFSWTINDAGLACMPNIATGGVVSVSEDSAGVEVDIINDGGGSVYDAGVQYGTDTNYGTSRSADSYTQGVHQVEIPSGDLVCETTYHYRGFIQNGAGTAYGDDATFTTNACPAPPEPYDLKLDITLNQPGLIQNQDASYTFTTSNLGPGVFGADGYVLYVVTPNGINMTDPQYEESDTQQEHPYYTDGENYQCYDYTSQVNEIPSLAYHLGSFYICFAFSGTIDRNTSHSVTLPFAVTDTVDSQTTLRAMTISGEDSTEVDANALNDAFVSEADIFSLPINNIARFTGTAPGSTINANKALMSNAEDAKPVSLQTPEGTTLTCSSTSKEAAQIKQDRAYQYPLGLVNFCFDTESQNNEVSLTFVTDLKPSDVKARKYNSTNQTYFDIPNATITETTSDGHHALKLTYTITDNGILDLNPETGKITDPVGLAITGGLASTGQSQLPVFMLAALMTLPVAMYIVRRMLSR